jgi:hypothetical protein
VANESVAETLAALLSRYGLGTLAGAVLGMAQQNLSDPEIEIKLQETPEWKARFIGNEIRRQTNPNLPILTAAEYLSKEDSLRAQMRMYGLPEGFYDQPDDFSRAIGADLGAQELGQRLEARKAVIEDGALTGALEYAQANYGMTSGDLLAMWIDPERATPLLTRQAEASMIGAAAARTGFGNITRTEAERLSAMGITAGQAASGYSQAAALTGLTEGTEDVVARDDLERANLEQDAGAQRRIERAQAARKAKFSTGGSYAESRTGIAGLGSANTS